MLPNTRTSKRAEQDSYMLPTNTPTSKRAEHSENIQIMDLVEVTYSTPGLGCLGDEAPMAEEVCKEDEIDKISLSSKLSSCVRLPASKVVTAIHLVAEQEHTSCCWYKKRIFCPILTISLSPEQRQLSGEVNEYRNCHITINLERIMELDADCVMRLKLKRNTKTIRKKEINAKHIIECIQNHNTYRNIHIALDVFSYHPLNYLLCIKAKETQVPKDRSDEGGAEHATLSPHQHQKDHKSEPSRDPSFHKHRNVYSLPSSTVSVPSLTRCAPVSESSHNESERGRRFLDATPPLAEEMGHSVPRNITSGKTWSLLVIVSFLVLLCLGHVVVEIIQYHQVGKPQLNMSETMWQPSVNGFSLDSRPKLLEDEPDERRDNNQPNDENLEEEQPEGQYPKEEYPGVDNTKIKRMGLDSCRTPMKGIHCKGERDFLTQIRGKKKDQAPLPFKENERQYRFSRRPIRRQASAPEGSSWSREHSPPAEGRILGWAINDQDAFFVSDRKGWDYGVSESTREALTDKDLEMYNDDDVGEYNDRDWAKEDPLTQFMRENPEITRDLRNYLENMNERKDRYEDDDDEAEEAKRIKEQEDMKRRVMHKYFNDIGKKPRIKKDPVKHLMRYWGRREMIRQYEKRLKKVMNHNYYLRQLQQKALFHLGKRPYTALITGRVTFSPEYVFHNNLDRLVLHLQFYLYWLEKDENNPVICEIWEDTEGSGNSLSVWLTNFFLFVKFSLKGVQEVKSYPIRQPVRGHWYHVRIMAMQTKVTVTVTSPRRRTWVITLPFRYQPVLAFGNMAVSVGSPGIRAYVMGLTVNNRLLNWTQAAYSGHQARMVQDQFMFQPVAHLFGYSEYYTVHCDSPYKLQHIEHIEIDLPVTRPNVRDDTPRVLAFAPTSEDTGWALVAVQVVKSFTRSWKLQFCLDWLDEETCYTGKVNLAKHIKAVLRLTWRKPQQSFTMELLYMRSLYLKQVFRYKTELPKCSSKIFIGGIDATWRRKMADSKRPVSNLRISLTRVVINKYNIQLNAMVSEPQDEQNYAALLNRGQHASSTKLGALPQSPLFISVPILGNEMRSLSCSYDSMSNHIFFGRANFSAFWIDQHGNYLAEGNGSEKRRFTELSVGGDHVDNLYACVIRMEGVLDMVPVTYAVFRVDTEYARATVKTFTAYLSGTAICRGARVTLCQTYQNIEEVEFEIQDWYNFIPYMLNVVLQKLVVPLHSGDYAVLKMALWMFVFFHFVVVVVFVALPNNNDYFHGATSRVNRFLANYIFPHWLSDVQQLLLMGERRRPFPYRPKPTSYIFPEKEILFSANIKMLLRLCNLLEPPDPEKQLIGYMLWSCLETGQLDVIEAQDIIMYFNMVHRRREPVRLRKHTLSRDKWLESRYGKKVQFNKAKLNRQYKYLHLGGREITIKGHLKSQVEDMFFVYGQLKPCLDQLEDICRKSFAKKITLKVRRTLKYHAWTVGMAVRVFLYYQKLPRLQKRRPVRRLPLYTKTKLYEHRQVAWVLMKHINSILVKLDRAPQHKVQMRILVIMRRMFADLEELRVRRYRTFLRHHILRSA